LPRFTYQGKVMGHYYFNIKDGQTLIPDPEGDELADESAAYWYIKETVQDLVLRPHVYRLERWEHREFVVTDESGRVVMTVPVAALLRPN
jgi:hypothetical protein